MRIPNDTVELNPHKSYKFKGLIFVFGLLVLFVIVQGISGFYINLLWFRAYHLDSVWKTLLAYKLGLGAVFIVLGFLVCWINVWLIERGTPPALALGYEHKYAHKFQHSLIAKKTIVRFLLSLLFGLVFGIGASGQWKNWLLFEHAISFGKVDPIFHRDISYFVFRLPFLTFIVSWMQVVIAISIVIALLGHVLSGAIRIDQRKLKIEQRALAHISLALAGFTLFRAWAYYYVDRFTLELSHDGVVAGASYIDIHVKLPADNLLAIVSLAAFVILVVNVYHRTLALLIISAGLWALLAVSLGVVYPAVVEAFQVLPQQNTLELASIKNNITATRYAMGIASIQETPFPANQDLNYSVVKQFSTEINNALLWDPTVLSQTLLSLQGIKNPYTLSTPQIDRYLVQGHKTPVVISAKVINPTADIGQSWVTVHTIYTHGQGAVAILGNEENKTGSPQFLLSKSTTGGSGNLHLRQADSPNYYSPISSGYIITNSRSKVGNHKSGHHGQNNMVHKYDEQYNGLGIGLGSLLVRMASAIHFDSASILFSNLINSNSELISIPNVVQELQRALPFLEVSNNPYPVISNGQLYWLDNAYTTSTYYPYGQPVDSSVLPTNSALKTPFNFIRDSVVTVENAATGNMNFYVLPGKNPLMASYEATFPGIFKPISAMNAGLRDHLKYPQSLFMLQSATYGLYHVKSPSIFYNSLSAWQIPKLLQKQSKSSSQVISSYGNATSFFYPTYEFLSASGQKTPSFDLVEPLVPYSITNSAQNLTSLLTVSSGKKTFGNMHAYRIPDNKDIVGPVLANNEIIDSKQLINFATLLNKSASKVVMGNIAILPIADSLLYLEPLYITPKGSQFLGLYGVAAYYQGKVAIRPNQQEAVAEIFNNSVNHNLTSPNISAAIEKLINQAVSDDGIANHALIEGNLGMYQLYEQRSNHILSNVQGMLKKLPVKVTHKKASKTTDLPAKSSKLST